jgi:SAM-dependent methyltransferase
LAVAVPAFLWLVHWWSYRILKQRALRRNKWDLNICCGATDGGGINVDIEAHEDLPNFCQVSDIYHLPFKDKQFDTVLCSHTLEHVDDPRAFYRELQRVGRHVTVLIPPLWDLSAAFSPVEHKWVFWSFRTEHSTLPPYSRLPLATFLHRNFGQPISA